MNGRSVFKHEWWPLAGLLALLALGQPSPAAAAPEISAGQAEVTDLPQAVQVEVPAPTLRTLDQMLADNAILSVPVSEVPAFLPTMDATAYEAAKLAAAATAPAVLRPEIPATALLAPPTLKTINCDGVDQNNFATSAVYPPDTDGAVGSTQVVQIVNSQIAVYDKVPDPLTPGCPAQLFNVSTNAFFGYFATLLFDAQVLYDPVFNRWIISAEAFPESAAVQLHFIGVSQTDDATGPFNIFAFNARALSGGGSAFWDYAKIGMDEVAIIVTGNVSNPGFVGARAWFLPKARLYANLGFSFCFFSGGPLNLGTTVPPKVLDQANTTVLTVAPNPVFPFPTNNFINITKFTATSMVCPIVLGSNNIPVAAYGIPPNAPQPGVPQVLDTLDNRFQTRSTQVGPFLWQTHVTNDFGFATPRFYRVNWTNNTIAQTGDFFAAGNSFDFAPSIAANGGNDVVVTWSTSASSILPQMRLSGKQNADPFIFNPGTLVASSTVPLTENVASGNVQRWGDYSSSAFDPSTGQWWIFNELAQIDPVSGASTWLTHFANAGIP